MKYQVITQDEQGIETTSEKAMEYSTALDYAQRALLDVVEKFASTKGEEEAYDSYKKGKKTLRQKGYIELYGNQIAVVLEAFGKVDTVYIYRSGGSECFWQDEILVHLNMDLLASLAKAHRILDENREIASIMLNMPYEFLTEETWQELEDDGRIGLEKIEVYRDTAYYHIYNKYDFDYYAEYFIGDLVKRKPA